MKMKVYAAGLALASTAAIAQTTLYLEDGSSITIPEGASLYISDEAVFTMKQLTPVATDDTPAEPEVKGSPEWCDWYEAINGGVIAPSFSSDYKIYTQNCI